MSNFTTMLSYMKSYPASSNFGALRAVGVLAFVLLFLTGCVTAPHAQQDEANSLGQGNWRLEGGVQPGLSFSAGTGISDNLDLGMQIDFYGSTVYTGWGKYSLINQDQGVSLAVIGGVFTETEEEYYGGFIGPIISMRQNNVLYSLRGRYNKLQGDAETDYFDSDNFYANERIGQVDASVRWYLNNDKLAIKVGAGCVFAIGDDKLNDTTTTDSSSSSDDKDYECSPTFGFSFYL